MINSNLPESNSSWRLCTAPMMDLTTRHCRMLFRMAGGNKVRLYTEMIVAQALTHGCKEKLLRYNPKELPVDALAVLPVFRLNL